MTQTNGTTLGLCPACGEGDLVESAKAWGCSRWKSVDGGCPYTIWKTVAGKKLTVGQIKQLLAGETTEEIQGFQNPKTRKIFSARLRIDDPDTGHVALVFEPRQEPRKQA